MAEKSFSFSFLCGIIGVYLSLTWCAVDGVVAGGGGGGGGGEGYKKKQWQKHHGNGKK